MDTQMSPRICRQVDYLPTRACPLCESSGMGRVKDSGKQAEGKKNEGKRKMTSCISPQRVRTYTHTHTHFETIQLPYLRELTETNLYPIDELHFNIAAMDEAKISAGLRMLQTHTSPFAVGTRGQRYSGFLNTFHILQRTKQETHEVLVVFVCFVCKAYLKHFPILNLIQSKSFPSRPSFIRRKMPCVGGTGQKTESLSCMQDYHGNNTVCDGGRLQNLVTQVSDA